MSKDLGEDLAVEFKYYQDRTWSTDRTSRQPWIGLAQSTFGLVEKMGTVTACLKKRIRDGNAYEPFKEEVSGCIGDALWYLTSVCSHLGIRLEDVADQNLISTEARWLRPGEEQSTLFSPFFDQEYPEHEQIPRKFRARFVERKLPQVSWLPMSEVWVDGERFGDPIDDNSPNADNYRLHDALHLANAAILSWSPVVRALLRRKRKSNPHMDKYEDGARAQDTEEALARLIHQEAMRNSWFENVNAIDTSFLMKVRAVVSDLEVRVRTAAEWQHCILEGYRIFRQLRAHGGGIVEVSLVDRTLHFEAETGAA